MGNSNNGFDKPVEPMTEQEISLVKECWDSIEDKQGLGMAIMLRLFLAHSEIKHKWIFAANLETEEEMLNNSQIKYHAKKIIDVFGKLVEGVVGHAELDNSSLERLGRNHFHYGVKVDDFVHFEESLVYGLKKCSTNKKFSHKTEKAWHKVFVIVVKVVLLGLNKEEAERANLKKT